MNFLGHIYLSGDDPNLLIGNYIADFVKGKSYQNYPENIQKGILMHRHIDEYTDSHQAFLKSSRKLFEHYRHYSGVITDVYFDHFLAKNWLQYHDTDLKIFSEDFYCLIEKHYALLPEKVKVMFHYMQKNNWLYNYKFTDGIQRTLEGLSKRTTFTSNMENAIHDLKRDYEWHGNNFYNFFEDIKEVFLTNNIYR